MGKIRLNQWFVKGNSLSITIPPFFICIERENSDLYILYSIDEKGYKLLLGFKNMEDAVTFTEKNYNKHNDRNTILAEYIKERNDSEDKLTFTPDDTKNILSNYFSNKYKKDLPCEYDLTIKNRKPDVTFYLGKDRLEEDEIIEALRNYADELGYSFNGFKYINGIHQNGYYLNNDTPYFHGIEMSVNKKKNKVLKYGKK